MGISDQQHILDPFREVPSLEPGSDVVGPGIGSGAGDVGGAGGRGTLGHDFDRVTGDLLALDKSGQLRAATTNRVGSDDYIIIRSHRAGVICGHPGLSGECGRVIELVTVGSIDDLRREHVPGVNARRVIRRGSPGIAIK